MKKLVLALAIACAGLTFAQPQAALAYNFGDYTSATLTTKAWEAFNQGDIEGVLAYTNKCLELYAQKAQEMQKGLKDYVQGEKEAIFAQWALNDVATSLFIQGEAYRKANMKEEAKAAYTKLINDYTFGQAWDPKGWFWKPAAAAQEKLAMLESGMELDFGDYTSSYLTGQAWKALGSGDTKAVVAYADKVVELYKDQASKMQQSLTEYPWESKDKIFEYWALNDVGTALFIKGEALKKAGEAKDAKGAYQELVDKYFYAQTWDPQGWFWKPAEAAQQSLEDLDSKSAAEVTESESTKS